jgi:cytochrome b pre-mRNA-processing protein 3
MGIGDIVVGKHIGKMISMLGGRIGAYRDGLAAGDLKPPLARNLYRAGTPDDAAQAHVAAALTQLHDALATTDLAALTRGELP